MTIDQENKHTAERFKNIISAIRMANRKNIAQFPGNSILLLEELARAIHACQTDDSPSIISKASHIKSEQQLLTFFELHAYTKALQETREQLLFNACDLVFSYAKNDILDGQRQDKIKLLNDTIVLAIQAVQHQSIDSLKTVQIKNSISLLIMNDAEAVRNDNELGVALGSCGAVYVAIACFMLLASLIATAAMPLLVFGLFILAFGIGLIALGAYIYQDSLKDANRHANHAAFFNQVKTFVDKDQEPVKTSQTGLFAKTQNEVSVEQQKAAFSGMTHFQGY